MELSEYQSISDHLKQLRANLGKTDTGETKYYKVRFQDALSLVGTRKAYLHRGDAYVDKSDLIYLVLLEYK